jgi:hypothetical protein
VIAEHFGQCGGENAEMRSQIRTAAVAALTTLFFPASVSAGSCESIQFTINPELDRRELLDCIKELKSEIFILRLQVQTEESLNRLTRSNLCLLAMEMKTENAVSIAETACEELKAAAKKKAAKSKKP